MHSIGGGMRLIAVLVKVEFDGEGNTGRFSIT